MSVAIRRVSGRSWAMEQAMQPDPVQMSATSSGRGFAGATGAALMLAAGLSCVPESSVLPFR